MTTLTRYAGVTATSGAGPKLDLLSNLVNNPRAGVSTANYSVSAGTGGAAVVAAAASGGPNSEAPSYFRATWTAAQTAATSAVQIRNGIAGTNLVTPNRIHIFRVRVRASYAAILQPIAGWYNEGTFSGTTAGAAVTLAPNVWTELTVEGTSHPNSNRGQLTIQPAAGSPLVPNGATIDTSAWMLHEKPTGAPATAAYGDGDLAGWEWLGTRHLSPSRGYGAIV